MIKLASSHLIATCATLGAIALFVGLGSQFLGESLDSAAQGSGLEVAFFLNIALIIFGWRRSKDLKLALEAHERAEKSAREAAYSDFTTGLANRRQLMLALEDLLGRGARATVILLDLDDFKKVNDLHGHVAGDQLLAAVASVLLSQAPEGACCARTGGDEFALVLPFDGEEEVEAVASAILEQLAVPVALPGAEARISASLGLARLGRKMSPVDALRRSDVAMYAAKRSGRNSFAWFDSKLEREVKERAELEADIKLGIERGEFVPFFQPLISLSNGELVGFEVLARWQSAKYGLVEPKQFISLAEECGIIGPLSLGVMEQALTEAKDWPAALKLAVNVSPVQFRDPDLAQRIVQILTRTGFPAQRLELEITEGSLLEDPKLVATIVASLKNLGMTISLDDFGTGYASLAQLRTLPFDRIKIDQTFIGSLDDKQSAAIVGTIAALGQSLSVPVTAEGVESEGVRGKLSGLGCSEAQGWLFGRAVSAGAVREFLSSGIGARGDNPAASDDGDDARKLASR
jgi:diguanylate cyclase (GGDEF)-like protein